MSSLVRILEAVKLLLLIGIFAAVSFEGVQLRPRFESGTRATAALVRESTLTMKNLREASEELKKASLLAQDQAKQALTVEKHADQTIRDLDAAVTKTDGTLNTELLPQFQQAIFDTDVSLERVSQSAQSSLSGVDDVTRALTANLSDPAIKDSLQHIDTASAAWVPISQNLAVTTDQSAATMTKVRQGVDYEVDELMKPISKIKAAFLIVLRGLGAFYGY